MNEKKKKKDGAGAGQTVPHVHFHILPRKLQGDRFSENNDDIYPELERNEVVLKDGLHVDKPDNTSRRSMADMEAEARWLQSFF